MTIREQTEELEYKTLAPQAAKAREAVRRSPIVPCQYRTDYQRDRDRILHAKCFRRLKHKTQVYIMSGDHYRTRMTHSLEVAQIGRTIARGLRLNEDLTEAIAIGHDVGHTPFGHSGEAVMAELTGHFTHNEQSLRVVRYLEREGKGLNLTAAVENGILNHTGPNRPFTLEGRIVHIADRIAYLCHDYDDSLRAGLLKPEDLPASVIQGLGVGHSDMITGFVSDVITASADLSDIRLSERFNGIMNEFRQFMFRNIYHSDHLSRERDQAGFILRQLYSHFLERFEELPEEFRHHEERWGRQQAVTDYVAGLTDGYAVELFNKIFIPPVAVYR